MRVDRATRTRRGVVSGGASDSDERTDNLNVSAADFSSVGKGWGVDS